MFVQQPVTKIFLFCLKEALSMRWSAGKGFKKSWGLKWPLRHSNAIACIFSTEVPLDTRLSLLSPSWEVWSLEHRWDLSRPTPFTWHPNEGCSLLSHSSLAESSLLTRLLLANMNKPHSSSEVFIKHWATQQAGLWNTLQYFRVVIS